MVGDPSHWNAIYQDKSINDVSWFEGEPATSLRLIDDFAGPPGAAVDVGAGRSLLAIRLIERGWRPVTAVDISEVALVHLAASAPADADLNIVTSDILSWQPAEHVTLWHDRAVFHFLTDVDQQRAYVNLAETTVHPGGTVVLGCFAADGPTQCSGLDVSRYQPGDLAAIFGANFSMQHSLQQDHHTPWGAMQRFTWVVLRRQD